MIAEISLVSLVVTLAIVGFLLWLANNYLPMDPKIKNILNWVVVICVVFWLLSVFFSWTQIDSIKVPRLR